MDLATNKKAFFQYEIVETFEVGIELKGTEVKSLRNHGASLQESFITVTDGQLWLVGASIALYTQGNRYNHEERRTRRLLAHRREITSIHAAIQEKGLTCIALAFYLKHGLVKARIAIAKGKTFHDKREVIRERDDKRAMSRAMKQEIL